MKIFAPFSLFFLLLTPAFGAEPDVQALAQLQRQADQARLAYAKARAEKEALYVENKKLIEERSSARTPEELERINAKGDDLRRRYAPVEVRVEETRIASERAHRELFEAREKIGLDKEGLARLLKQGNQRGAQASSRAAKVFKREKAAIVAALAALGIVGSGLDSLAASDSSVIDSASYSLKRQPAAAIETDDSRASLIAPAE